MKNTLIFLYLLASSTLLSQNTLDSISLYNLKEEIKKELKQEMLQEEKEVSFTKKPANEQQIKKEKFNLEEQLKNVLEWGNFKINAYGVVNYYHYDYDTDLNLKDKLDAERLNIYLNYKFNEHISFKSEIEFEHGGTGSALELDSQEEFGEYEQEVEKGGSVKIEQLHINFALKPYINIRAGRMKVYFGLHQTLDQPTRYFTTTRQEMENELLPLGWYENGIEIHGVFAKKFSYRFYVVNGLDASGFSSRNWIKRGYQQKFELSNAQSFAFAARLDYAFGKHKDTFVGAAAYVNNSAANRPKNDMKETAYVTLVEAHISYNEKNLRFNAIGLFGNLENSDIVSLRNANLSNALGAKRTPVGKNALGVSAEIGYNVLAFFKHKTKQSLYPFLRYDFYDTMLTTEGNIVKNPRWQRSTIAAGFNWFVHPQIVYKIQYAHRTLGSENYDPNTLLPTGKKQQENTFSMGIGFQF
jgi:hypothetical protein